MSTLSISWLIITRYISLLRSPANMQARESVRNKAGELVVFLNNAYLTRDWQNKKKITKRFLPLNKYQIFNYILNVDWFISFKIASC